MIILFFSPPSCWWCDDQESYTHLLVVLIHSIVLARKSSKCKPRGWKDSTVGRALTVWVPTPGTIPNTTYDPLNLTRLQYFYTGHQCLFAQDCTILIVVPSDTLIVIFARGHCSAHITCLLGITLLAGMLAQPLVMVLIRVTLALQCLYTSYVPDTCVGPSVPVTVRY